MPRIGYLKSRGMHGSIPGNIRQRCSPDRNNERRENDHKTTACREILLPVQALLQVDISTAVRLSSPSHFFSKYNQVAV